MANNPFDDDQGRFFALVNHEEQYSLWPTFKPVPGGWAIAHGAPDGVPRAEVLEWIERTWTDLRPKSLRDVIARRETGDVTASVNV
ncbi:MbtH family protein [Rhodococcus sp. 14-2470-1a]|uniref:MbtH family protein n=1 Tax=Rhodococcus sp. 14-2470-1a TaxID=2023150 RepID=UPI000B9C143C|nr:MULTISPECIES: MbtH family protein [unclassified Rhodococcus (in: high G+C Gram-positive bacteria)]OZD64960.1 MbtH family protein [Rhodococcus sp. 06-1059B-a]OZF41779.1 MbtH family protein [Rhodococcus sp. 14-2470-1a]